jgi:hypothetical protein
MLILRTAICGESARPCEQKTAARLQHHAGLVILHRGWKSARMKMKLLPGTLILGLCMLAGGCLPAYAEDDAMPPEARAAIKAASKNAAKAGVEMPDLKELMKDDEKTETQGMDTEDEKPKAAPTAKVPLAKLPAWIPAVPGFKPSPGGRCWTEDGNAKGGMSGAAPGKPRELADAYAKTAKPKFSGVTTNYVTINDALTVTVFLEYLRDAEGEHRAEVEFKPASGGKSCAVTISYTEPMPAK